MWSVKKQPEITVGIMDRQTEVFGRLDGNFWRDGFGPVSGRFSAKPDAGMIVLYDAPSVQSLVLHRFGSQHRRVQSFRYST